MRFSSAIRPAWSRKSPQVSEALPLLYLHGLSTSDFAPALEQLGRDARVVHEHQCDPLARLRALDAAHRTGQSGGSADVLVSMGTRGFSRQPIRSFVRTTS